MTARVSPLDRLAVTTADCRILAVVFGFRDTAEFQEFAKSQQVKHAQRQLAERRLYEHA